MSVPAGRSKQQQLPHPHTCPHKSAMVRRGCRSATSQRPPQLCRLLAAARYEPPPPPPPLHCPPRLAHIVPRFPGHLLHRCYPAVWVWWRLGRLLIQRVQTACESPGDRTSSSLSTSPSIDAETAFEMPAALNPNAAAFVPPTSALSAVLSATALERSPSMPLAIPAKSGAERLRPAKLQEDDEEEELERLQQQLFAADDEDPALVSAWPLVTRMRRFTALSSRGMLAISNRRHTACQSSHREQHLAPCHVGPAKFPAWP